MKKQIKTKFVNCTPHTINVITDGGTLKIEPSDMVARCTVETVHVGTINGVKITESEFGEVENLPNPKEGVFFIVSRLVLAALPSRSDLLVPNELVRDEKGRVTGCKSLSRK